MRWGLGGGWYDLVCLFVYQVPISCVIYLLGIVWSLGEGSRVKEVYNLQTVLKRLHTALSQTDRQPALRKITMPFPPEQTRRQKPDAVIRRIPKPWLAHPNGQNEPCPCPPTVEQYLLGASRFPMILQKRASAIDFVGDARFRDSDANPSLSAKEPAVGVGWVEKRETHKVHAEV